MENGEKILNKLFDILELLASASEPRPVREIARSLEIPESTVYRILKYLGKRNYIERTPRGILLGGSCLYLGTMAQEQNILQRTAHPVLAALAEKTRETVHLARLLGGVVSYIDKVDGKRSIRMGSMIGRTSPVYCTGIGKAMLSALDPGELETLLAGVEFRRFTENTVTAPEVLLRELELCRKRGYAVDNCEHEPGVYCIAAPIIGRNGKVAAGLSLAGMSTTLKPETERLAGEVVAAARAVSEKL